MENRNGRINSVENLQELRTNLCLAVFILIIYHKTGSDVKNFLPIYLKKKLKFFKVYTDSIPMTHKDKIKILCYYNIVMQFLDGFFTYWGVSNYGPYIEGNPFIRELILEYGDNSIIVVKVLAILLILGFVWLLDKKILVQKECKIVTWIFIGLNILYTVVVLIWAYAYMNPHII